MVLIRKGDDNIKTYYINNETLVIIPISSKTTRIIEKNQEIIDNNSSMKIIDYNCKINGSSYIGRYESAKLLLEKKSKLPIIIEEKNDIIYIPTNSIRNDECCWISYNNIVNYYKNDKKVTIVFENNKKVDLNISYNIFEKQINKVVKLLAIKKMNNFYIKS